MPSIGDFPDVVKPGEGLYTAEFRTWSRSLSPAERGAAVSILALMMLGGSDDLPGPSDVPDMLHVLHLRANEARHFSAALRKLSEAPEDVFRGQLAHMGEWPSWMIEELVP